MATATAPGLPEIERARERLDGVARVTPVFPSETLSRLAGRPVRLKAENLQRTGSFKIRGAYVKLSSLEAERLAAGVVAASAGNHGQAVAWAARELGAPARIFMPQDSPMAKVDATRNYGAEVELTGPAFEETLEAALAYAEQEGAEFIHPYEDTYVMSGQGTIGLELAEQVAELETVVIPIGGGGLASGISLALRAVRPGLRLVGVQAAGTRPGGSGYHDRRRDRGQGAGRADDGDPRRDARRHRRGRGRADRRGDRPPRRADEARRRGRRRRERGRDPRRPRRRWLRAGARASLGRQHRRLAHGAGDAARAGAPRPLPRRCGRAFSTGRASSPSCSGCSPKSG